MEKVYRQMGKHSLKCPKIGVTGPNRGGEVAWIFTALSILVAGGWPVWIRPKNPKSIEKLQGIIIGGGSDIDPNVYEQEDFIKEYLRLSFKDRRKNIFQKIGSAFNWLLFPVIFLLRKIFSQKNVVIDKDRDQLEINMIDQAVKNNLPILGICRGAQLLNVYFKGSLYQDIGSFYYEKPNRQSIFPVKRIYIKPGSKLSGILNVEKIKVNALHHQAVKDPGDNVDVVAKESNDIVVQGIENTKQDFIIGVQWHPEYLIQNKRQRKIFKELVKSAKTTKR